MKMSNKMYDTIRLFAEVILPFLSTMIAVLGGIWEMESSAAIAGGIMAFDAALGGFVSWARSTYSPDTSNDDEDGEDS